jgi:aspartokinase
MKGDILSAVRDEGLDGFLEHAKAENADDLPVKLGGTAMKDIMEKGPDSAVLQGINKMQGKYKHLVLVVSAPGEYQGNKTKITQRLIKNVLEAHRKGDQAAAESELKSLLEDHLRMASDTIPEAKKDELKARISRQFEELSAFLRVMNKEGVTIPPELALDTVAGFGEELGSMILAAILEAQHISTSNTSITNADQSLEGIVSDFSQGIQSKLVETSTDQTIVVSGFPGFIEGKSTIAEMGMGYTDFHCVMAAKPNSFVVLMKKSGAILQTDAKLLPKSAEVEQIKVMPMRQAVRMTELIGDQIQVIHPLALHEAQKKGLTSMVVNEEDPFSTGGTLILPNNVYDKYSQEDIIDQNESLPMMGVAENARQVTIHLKTPINDRHESDAFAAINDMLNKAGIKIIDRGKRENDDDGNQTISLLVSGLKDDMVDKINANGISDVEKIKVGAKSFIVGISGIPKFHQFEQLSAQAQALLPGSSVFNEKRTDKLCSFGLFVPVDGNNGTSKQDKLQQLLALMNTPKIFHG